MVTIVYHAFEGLRGSVILRLGLKSSDHADGVRSRVVWGTLCPQPCALNPQGLQGYPSFILLLYCADKSLGPKVAGFICLTPRDHNLSLWEVRVGAEAENTEECCLTAPSLAYAQPAFQYSPAPPA